MPLAPVSFTDVIANEQSSPKWIFNSNRDLVPHTPLDIPYEYDPITGECIGVSMESASVNYYADTLGMSSQLVYSPSGISRLQAIGQYSLMFFPNIIRFDANVEEKQVEYIFDTPVAWDYVGISFFIRSLDGTEPLLGRTYNRTTNFHITMNNLEIMDASSQFDIKGPLKDGSYWFRGRIKTPTQPVYSIQIGTERRQVQKEFIIGGLQIEKNKYSSFMPSDGAGYSRQANYLRAVLPLDNLMNPEQGTIDVTYRARNGSLGTFMRMYNTDESEKITIGHMGEIIDAQPDYSIKVESATTAAYGTILRPEDSTMYEFDNKIRFCYSPYGIRLSANNTPILRFKDFHYNKNTANVPNQIIFGVSEDGTNFDGHLVDFNVHGRAYRDNELVDY